MKIKVIYKKVTICFLGLMFFCIYAKAEGEHLLLRRNTNIQIESVTRNPLHAYNDDKDKEGYGVAVNESTSLSVNENGDPSIGTRF